MKFNVKSLALTAGLFWGLAILIVALANLIWPPYGRAFLDLSASRITSYNVCYTKLLRLRPAAEQAQPSRRSKGPLAGVFSRSVG